MPKLLLHIGTHKTGTTSIQRFCSSNRDQLRKLGVWYPPADIGNFSKHYAHHHIAHAIAGRHESRTIDDARDFFDCVRSDARPDEVCVISAEPMYRHFVIGSDEGEVPAAELVRQREARMGRYAQLVRDCIGDFDVGVLVMLRRQDLFLESLYAEQILSTGYNRGIERYAVERDHLLDYESRLDGWAHAFGAENISVKIFERSALTSPIERIFVEWIGLDWDERFKIGDRHNVTPPRSLVEFKRLVNTPGQSVAVNNRLRRWVEEISNTTPADKIPDLGRYYLQPRDRVELLERYEGSNGAVAARYTDRDELFADDVDDDLARYVDRASLGQKQFRQLVQRLVQQAAAEGG